MGLLLKVKYSHISDWSYISEKIVHEVKKDPSFIIVSSDVIEQAIEAMEYAINGMTGRHSSYCDQDILCQNCASILEVSGALKRLKMATNRHYPSLG